MVLKKINTTFLIFLLLFLSGEINIYGQNSDSIYDWFDQKTGKENLAINNGKLLLNYDRVANNNDRFYFSQYVTGTVVYDDQTYNNVVVNYDLYNDDLILKPNGEADKSPIILVKDKVQSFSIDKKNYVNLNYSQTKIFDIINGYYEEGYIGNQLRFYIKHAKTRTERINSDGPYDDFTEKTYFILNYKNEYFKISSKKSIITIFPEYKKLINEFYSTNDYMIKLDKSKFLTNLFTYLNSNIQ